MNVSTVYTNNWEVYVYIDECVCNIYVSLSLPLSLPVKLL